MGRNLKKEESKMSVSDEKNQARIVTLADGEKVFVTRGIFDYFDEKNFKRLLDEYNYAKKAGVRFYVGLYSDAILEKSGHTRPLSGKVKDEDRVMMLEAVDFVDGAFIIDELTKTSIMKSLNDKLYVQSKTKKTLEDHDKKYEIGYASGGFSNLHKGHIEHLREMSRQCNTTVVAVNSDRLMQEYKHKNASVNEDTRRCILSHIRYVDVAIITDDYDKLRALDVVKGFLGKYFDAIFVGSDWKGDPKWEEFEKKLSEMGVDVVFTDRPKDGISTTAIDKKKIERTAAMYHGDRRGAVTVSKSYNDELASGATTLGIQYSSELSSNTYLGNNSKEKKCRTSKDGEAEEK